MYTLGELAGQLGLAFTGDAARPLTGLAPLADAGADQVSFLAESRLLKELANTRAGAVIVAPEHADQCPADCLLSDAPYLAFARASRLFDPAPHAVPGVHPAAVVHEDSVVDPSAEVAAGVIIDCGARIGPGAVLAPGVVVGRDCRIGAGTRLYPNVVLYADVWLGEACTVHGNAVLGADGFGFAPSEQGWEKIHQLAGVRIGDRVEIGAGTTIDRGTLAHTVIEDGVIIDNQVQVGHNCRIGRNSAVAGCVGLAGSTHIGANCTLAGGVGVVGHVSICDNVHITGMTMVTRSITEPGTYSSGTPMSATAHWKRQAVRFGQLDSLHDRLVALERASPVDED